MDRHNGFDFLLLGNGVVGGGSVLDDDGADFGVEDSGGVLVAGGDFVGISAAFDELAVVAIVDRAFPLGLLAAGALNGIVGDQSDGLAKEVLDFDFN